MFCNYCGAQNLDTATSCQRCGKRFEMRHEYETHSPPPPSPTSAAFISVIKQQKNRGYAIAGIGALVALFAFFFLPYSTVYGDYFGQATRTALSSGLGGGWMWLEAFLAVAALVVVALQTSTDNPSAMKAPIVAQTRQRIYALIGSGALGIMIQLLITLDTYNRFLVYVNNGASYWYNAGYWLYLLGMGAVIVGGVITLRRRSSSPPTHYH